MQPQGVPVEMLVRLADGFARRVDNTSKMLDGANRLLVCFEDANKRPDLESVFGASVVDALHVWLRGYRQDLAQNLEEFKHQHIAVADAKQRAGSPILIPTLERRPLS